MKLHTFEVTVPTVLPGNLIFATVTLGGVKLYEHDVTRIMTNSAPTRREEAEEETMHAFALRLQDAMLHSHPAGSDR